MAIGVISILAIVAIAIGYFLYTLTPGIQARMIPVAVTAEAAESFDQKLGDLKTQLIKAPENGDKQEITVTITENEINSKLLELLAEDEIPLHLSKPLINLRDGRFLIYGVIDVPGVSAKTGAIGRIEIAENNSEVIIEDFDIGKLPLPKRVNKRVEDITNILVKLQLADWPLEVTKITITDRQLTFTAREKSTL